MVGDAFIVEGSIRLLEVCEIGKADLGREDVVMNIVKMIPEIDTWWLNASIGEVAQHERIADLTAKGDVLGFCQNLADVLLPSVLMGKGIVGDQGT